MKLLVIGAGGREHALAWRLSRDSCPSKVFVASGNAGTAADPGLVNLPLANPNALANFAEREKVRFTVVGPESFLADGIVDIFRARGQRIFGPTRDAARLETSKDFAKRFMLRHNIPTAFSETFTDAMLAHDYVDAKPGPFVIKADGLASGKGVVVTSTHNAAHCAIDDMLIRGKLGAAGSRVLIEDFLEGEEASFIVMVDGKNILPLASSQDHKRIFDGDRGPNTGGMGAYSPAPVVTPEVHGKVMREIICPAIRGLVAEGMPYVGFLYAGLMIGDDGSVRTVEFNCRMGDPEAQPILMRLKSNLPTLIELALEGKLDQADVEWDHRTALGVVIAASGYPETPRKGDVITGIPEETEEVKVFHAGTTMRGDETVTSGGRVLCVTALGENIHHARENAYATVDKIRFDGMQFRKDIGNRAANSNDPSIDESEKGVLKRPL
ncbi:MAG: phosphoribosylamine--glycine ligase [Candidatus Accumulibacter sp.]|jgi:phosphoribosylamine--glycine ligase|nr:phosphoribosylamine--glycine ligase [Accumulibacter sp.]